MAKVHVVNVNVMENPAPFLTPFQFEITFECIEDLKGDLEWKIIYVGSAESEQYDQILDTVYVGPVPEGRHMFVFQAPPPDPTKIPVQDVVGVTVVLITCSYHGDEFIRVGYYVNNEYTDPELKENPPTQPIFEQLERSILATSPRVTRFKIDWGESASENNLDDPIQGECSSQGSEMDVCSSGKENGTAAANGSNPFTASNPGGDTCAGVSSHGGAPSQLTC